MDLTVIELNDLSNIMAFVEFIDLTVIELNELIQFNNRQLNKNYSTNAIILIVMIILCSICHDSAVLNQIRIQGKGTMQKVSRPGGNPGANGWFL